MSTEDASRSANECYVKGNEHYEREEYGKALECYSKALVFNPAMEKAYYNRALAHCQLNHYTEAIVDLDWILDTNPKNAEAYYIRGLAYEYMKMIMEATRNYITLLSMVPDHADALTRMAYIWSTNAQKTAGSLRDFAMTSYDAEIIGRKQIEIIFEETDTDNPKAVITQFKAEDINLSEVALTLEAKAYVQKITDIIRHPGIAEECKLRRPIGVILEGPNGTGKTVLAHSIAGELGWHIVIVSFAGFASKWQAQTERNLADLFRKLRSEKMRPAVILFDEIDSMARSKDSESRGHECAMVNTFITEINKLLSANDAGDLFIVGTTNHIDLIDPSITRRGRLDCLRMPLPPTEVREKIFRIHLKDKPLARDVDFKALARMTDGKSGADIAGYANDASFHLFQSRLRNKKSRKITMDMLEEIIRVPASEDQPKGYA